MKVSKQVGVVLESVSNINLEPHVTYVQKQCGSPYVTGILPGNTAFDEVVLSASKHSNPIKATFDSILAEKFPTLFMKKYLNPRVLKKAYDSNPNIGKLLDCAGLPHEFYIENITGENQKHFLDTYRKAIELENDFSKSDKTAIRQAALLHDIGKAYIPVEILNKPDKLTKEERDIVDIHAKLGAEILKTTGISPNVAHLVEVHHMPCNIPFKGRAANILSVADVHSALKEKRSYKEPFSDEVAMKIMLNNKNLDSEIVARCFA